VALLEYRDTSLKTDSDVAVSLSLPVLAVIPTMITTAERRKQRRRRRLVATAAGVLTVAAIAAVVLFVPNISRVWGP